MKRRSSEKGRVVIYKRILKYLTRVHKARNNSSFMLFILQGEKMHVWNELFGISDLSK